MNLGIVVEDLRDVEAYSELIRKIRNDIETIDPYPCGGNSTLKKQFVKGLKRFKWYAPGSPHAISKALVIVDSDCSDASVWEEDLAQILDSSHFDPGFAVHFHATKCELESWLLADENAMSNASQHRGKNRHMVPANIQFELYRDAKELFQKRLSEAGLPDTPQVYKEIASYADIDRIASQCPRFKLFIKKVCQC
jgi:Domain of unknown function (DUF4276)